jgi:hypothetical protein
VQAALYCGRSVIHIRGPLTFDLIRHDVLS